MNDTRITPQSESEIEATLIELVDTLSLVHPDDLPGELAEIADAFGGARVSTFANDAVMTNNKGVTIRLRNGAEFQLTIVQSNAFDFDNEDEDDECETCGLDVDDCECLGPRDDVDSPVGLATR